MSLRATNSTRRTSRVFLGPQGGAVLVCGLLVMLVLVIYWQTREFTFLTFDDNLFVYQNEHVLRGLTWENVRWSLTAGIGKDSADIDFWRPLSMLSHMLDVSLFGLNAGAHHLMSMALHALTAVALFLVLRMLTAALWRSAFVAALFAVHPLHVESVAWVSERKDVLSGLFFVLTLGAYWCHALRPFRWGRYLLVLLLSALAMMSKPMLVTLPCVLLLVDLWPLNRLGVVPLKHLLVEKVPLFIMAALVAGFTLAGHGARHDVLWAQLPWYFRAGNAVLSYGIYIWQTLWPADLCCFYPYPGISHFVPTARTTLNPGEVIAALVMLLTITAIVWWRRKQPCIVVGWLWYLGMLVPVIGLFTQSGDQAHADRYTYLAMTGLGLMVAWPAAEWAGNSRSRRQLTGGAAVLALVVLTFVARKQVSHWRDNVSLWSRAVACNPEDHAARCNLAKAFADAGRVQDAVASYQSALKLNPQIVSAGMYVGIALLQMGRLEEAESYLRTVLGFEPQIAEAHSSLANILVRTGRLKEAASHFQTAVDITPDAANCCNLGNIQLQTGQPAKAIESYLRALAADPGHVDASFSLGMIYDRLGEKEVAAGYYERALAANPRHLPSANNLAWLLATCRKDSLRDGARALALAEQALQLPGGSQVHLLHTLAAAYAETGQFDKAGQTALQAANLADSQGSTALAQQLHVERRAYLSGIPWRE